MAALAPGAPIIVNQAWEQETALSSSPPSGQPQRIWRINAYLILMAGVLVIVALGWLLSNALWNRLRPHDGVRGWVVAQQLPAVPVVAAVGQRQPPAQHANMSGRGRRQHRGPQALPQLGAQPGDRRRHRLRQQRTRVVGQRGVDITAVQRGEDIGDVVIEKLLAEA